MPPTPAEQTWTAASGKLATVEKQIKALDVLGAPSAAGFATTLAKVKADAACGPAPEFVDQATGFGRVESFTVLFAANGAVAQSLAGISVRPIPGRAGWFVRNALADRLAAAGDAAPRYRLEVELDDQITGFGVRSDNAVTRERRTLRARYRLIDASAGTVVVGATAGSDAGIDVGSSEYATIAAEESALERLSGEIADQIVVRLALYASRTAANAP